MTFTRHRLARLALAIAAAVAVAASTSSVRGEYHFGGSDVGKLDNVVMLSAVTPVPEPKTYAMLLAGLGLLGFVARRRRTAVD